MAYKYDAMKSSLFTDTGQRVFLKVRDKVKMLLRDSGCFMMDFILDVHPDPWVGMSCVDRMVELGELQEIVADGNRRAAQGRIFVSG
jgi:hypothetical protein